MKEKDERKRRKEIKRRISPCNHQNALQTSSHHNNTVSFGVYEKYHFYFADKEAN
jgi:hypothetical protein